MKVVFTEELPWTSIFLSKDLNALLETVKCNIYPKERNPAQKMLHPLVFPQLPGAQGSDPQPCPAAEVAQDSRAEAVTYFRALGKSL